MSPRYEVMIGGPSEQGLLLIIDRVRGLIVARSHELAAFDVQTLVTLANRQRQHEATLATPDRIDQAINRLVMLAVRWGDTGGFSFDRDQARKILAEFAGPPYTS